MTLERTLQDYLQQARECTDIGQLKYDFGISDNFDVLFFGDSPQILSVLKDAFMHSPQSEGLQLAYHLFLSSPKGHYSEISGLHSSCDLWVFRDLEKKVWVELRARYKFYHQYSIGGLPRSDVSIMFHPDVALSESCDEEGVLYLKPVVLDIGDLIVKKGLTAGFTHFLPGEEWYHVPK